MQTLIQQIRLATVWNQEGRRIRLTRIWFARAIGAKKCPRKKLTHPHPIGWALYVWYYDVSSSYRKAKSNYHYPWHHYRGDRKSYLIKMPCDCDKLFCLNFLVKGTSHGSNQTQ